ncbi:MAG: hypothetical protein DDT18_00051 [Actinobacteria bacterium]|nr:hypothetical protein [Actinomycetota bacterium]
MWKTKFLKWAYELNTRLKLPDIKFVSGIKRWGKRFMFRVLAPNKLMLVNIHGMPFYIHSTPASIQEYILQPYGLIQQSCSSVQ